MRSLVVMAFIISAIPVSAAAVDEPPHKVLVKDGAYELRQYDSMLLAEVKVSGDMKSASSRGFRPLADFIFGNNISSENIEMTAPVTRTKATKIKMTAPVTRVENQDKSWTVAFVMPAKWTIENLPKPNNPGVSIRELPSELIASILFSGRGSETSHNRKQVELETWIAQQGYQVTGEPRYAGYDAPWVPWPFRRNEVMIPVAKGSRPE